MEIIHEISGIDICCHNLICDSTSFLHWHENYEICHVLNQPAAFLVDGQIIEASPGDLINIEESVIHRFLIDQPQTIIRVIQFPTKALLNTASAIKPLKLHIKQEEISQIPMLSQKLERLFELMEAEGSDHDCQKNPYLQSLTVSLYFLLMRSFAAETSVTVNAEVKNTFFHMLEYISVNFTDNITVQSIAATLYLSRNTAASIFSKYSGTTLNAYINMLRINKANQLMNQGCNITEAALASGFQSIRNFNIVYKRITGITPSQYHRSQDIVSVTE